jgi:TRAP-type C4-dicarboxylate transport system permease small subunit
MDSLSISKTLKKFSTGIGYIGAFALFAMMLLTTTDVVGRYLFNKPLTGAYELTEFLVLILIFSFLSNAQAHKDHVSVDLIFTRFPKKFRFVVNLFNHIICFVLMVLITWMSLLKALELKEVGEASPNLVIPDYPFVFFLVIGCLVLCIEYLRDLILIVSGNEDKEGKSS